MDNLKNFASSILASGIDATQLTASVSFGEGNRFPSSDFNVIIWDASYNDMSEARYSNALAIYRVVSRIDDTFTFQADIDGNRQGQEGTASLAHNAPGITYNFALCVTTKLFDDIDSSMSNYQPTTLMSNWMGTSERGNYFYSSNHTFANSTHIHGSLALTNISASSASDGLSLSVGNYITTAMHSDAGSNFVGTGNSSLFQFTSATSVITSNALNTSGESKYQFTSATSAITSNAVNTSALANLQYTSATSLITSNALNSSGESKYQFTSATSLITSNALNSSGESKYQFTSATSAITANAVNTSVLANLQYTSATSALTSNAQNTSATSAITSNAVNTSVLANLQYTSATSNFTSNAVNTSALANLQYTSATSVITSNAVNTSILANIQYTSATSIITSNAQNTSNTSAITANAVNTSILNNLQYTSATSAITANALNSSATSAITSNAVNTSILANLQYTSATSIITASAMNTSERSSHVTKWSLVGGNTAGTTTQGVSNNVIYLSGGNNVTLSGNVSTIVFSIPNVLTTAMISDNTSVFQYTSATSAITSNAANTSILANLQYTSATSLITSNAQNTSNTSAITSNAVNTSVLANLQYTSATSVITSNAQNTSNTSAITANAINTSERSSYLTKWSLLGNTAGTNTQGISNNIVYFSGGNNVTLSGNASTIVISGANAGGAQTGISGQAVSDTTYTSGTVIFSAQTNITLGSSANAGSQYIRFSVGNYLTTAMISDNTSVFQYTSATSAITSNAVNTSVLANLQYTSATSAITSNAQNTSATSAITSNAVNTSVLANLQYTSATSAITASAVNTSATTAHVTKWSLAGGNTAGTTTQGISNNIIYFSGGNNVTLSGNSSTIVFSIPNVLTTAMISDNTSVFQYTSATSAITSNAQNTSNTSAITSNAVNTSVLASLQYTSATSAITANAINTSERSSYATKWSLVGGNTAGTTTQGISNNIFYLSGGNNVTLSGNASTVVISIPNVLTTAMLSDNTSVFQYTSATSAITSNAQNTSNTSAITANAINTSERSSYMTKWSLAGVNTSGTTTQGVSNNILYLSGGNNVTLSGNASTIIFSIPNVLTTAMISDNTSVFQYTSATSAITSNAQNTSNTSVITASAMNTSERSSYVTKWSLVGGNTAGTTTQAISNNVIYLSGGNNVTLSGNASTIVFSAGAGGAGVAVADSAASSVTNGTVQFANSNGVSFGLNGSTMTASFSGGGGNGVAVYASDGTFSTGTVSLSASGGAITINTEASKIGFSVPATSSLSAVGNITISSNVSTISLSVAGVQGVAGSSASSVTNGVVQFSNMNGISFGLNVSTMTASTNNASLVSQWSLAGANTAGTTTQNISNNIIYLSGGNNVTLSGNASTIVFSIPAVLTTAMATAERSSYVTKWSLAGANTAGTTTQGISNNLIYLSGGNNVTLSGNASTIVVSIPNVLTTAMATGERSSYVTKWSLAGANTAGTTTQGISNNIIYLSGGNNITLSGNASTIVFSANVATVGLWEPLPVQNTGTIQSNGTLFVYPITAGMYITASRAEFVVSVQQSVNATLKNQANISLGVLIYTSSNDGYRLATVSSGTTSYTNGSIGSGSSSNSVSYVGVIKYSVPININMTPGIYWIGLWSRSTVTSASATNNNQDMSMHGVVFRSTNWFAYEPGAGSNSAISSFLQVPQGFVTVSRSETDLTSPIFIARSTAGGATTAGQLGQASRMPYVIFQSFTWTNITA